MEIDYSKDVSNLEVELKPGMVRIALYAMGDDPFIPDDYTTDELLKLDHVDEVGACGAQDYHVILVFDSIAQMHKEIMSVQLDISATLAGCQLRKLIKRDEEIIEYIQDEWEVNKGEIDKDTITWLWARYDITAEEWITLVKKARAK